MQMIEGNALRKWLDNFYGYGSWRARVWFVDYEETGGDMPEEAAEKFNYFYNTPSVAPLLCNIRELYASVAFRVEGPRGEKFATLNDQRFGPQAALHGAWKNLIAFVHGLRNEKLPDLLMYQRCRFASADAESEALIPLYPLPAHNHAWYYAWLDLPQLPFLKSRALYQHRLYSGRIQTILQNINVFKPEVVVLYGMENINLLKRSVQQFFPDAKFKMVRAIKRQIPQHHRADLNATTLLITTQKPALRHNRIETGFDWYEFGKLARPIY